jgi:hypothetical protein
MDGVSFSGLFLLEEFHFQDCFSEEVSLLSLENEELLFNSSVKVEFYFQHHSNPPSFHIPPVPPSPNPHFYSTRFKTPLITMKKRLLDRITRESPGKKKRESRKQTQILFILLFTSLLKFFSSF